MSLVHPFPLTPTHPGLPGLLEPPSVRNFHSRPGWRRTRTGKYGLATRSWSSSRATSSSRASSRRVSECFPDHPMQFGQVEASRGCDSPLPPFVLWSAEHPSMNSSRVRFVCSRAYESQKSSLTDAAAESGADGQQQSKKQSKKQQKKEKAKRKRASNTDLDWDSYEYVCLVGVRRPVIRNVPSIMLMH